MKMLPEWDGRLRHWIHTLKEDFYKPLGEISFEICLTDNHLTPEEAEQQKFIPISPQTRWGAEWQYAWLRARVVLPQEAQGEKIALDLHPGGETTIFVNGETFGTYRNGWIDAPHHFLVDNWLTECGRAGESFDLLCEAYAGHFYPESPLGGVSTGPVLPGAYEDPLAGQERALLETSTFGLWNEDAYQLWLDVQTLLEVMEYLPDGSLRAAKIAKSLQEFTLTVDFEQAEAERKDSYRCAREGLQAVLQAVNGSTAPKFYAVGNSHLDICWLWPLAETIRKTARTFAAQLRLLEKYPSYHFLQSQPYSYALCKEHYPALYAKIQKAVKDGRWIAEGGMWVEPDTNMISGESMVRQLIHGLKFFQDEFGVTCKILWLPDTFGYSAALPQILKDCGIEYLVTQKIFWSYNGGEQFPYHYFNWQGMDGTRIVSFLPTSYTYTTNPKLLAEVWQDRVLKDEMDKFLLPFGYGDGGGGPCRDHIEFALREKNLEGCPQIEMTGPLALFEDLQADGGPKNTYVGELYFTAHRGVYTAQAAVKRGNRKAELALREGEMWGAIACFANYKYPYAQMDGAWKKTLFCQFHDILPGSSIKRVYEEASVTHGEVMEIAQNLANSAAQNLAGAGENVTIFNSLSWERDVIVSIPGEPNKIITAHLPACGFTSRINAFEPQAHGFIDGEYAVLKNEYVKVVVDKEGGIISFELLENGREIVSEPMNVFSLYKDVPRNFDAWDIDSVYLDEPVPMDGVVSVTLIDEGPYKAAIKLTKAFGNSTLTQNISLWAKSRRVEFDTTVDWHELHRLLKVDFPIKIYSEEAFCEMQYGYVKRPTHRSRAYDKDRFEVCNHRYTALCDESHGAAVLNDCKYGVSCLGNTISLTLLRAEASPEMRGDNGVHRFVYAFTAWNGPFANCRVVREGYELNIPPLVCLGTKNVDRTESFFEVESESVILDTIKPAEDGSGQIIVRLYESKRGDCECILRWNLPLQSASLTNMLEDKSKDTPLAVTDRSTILHFRPFEIKTLRLF